MKTRLPILKLLIVLCTAFATTAVFGQVTRVWTNNFPLQLAGNGDFAVATNWSPNGIPIGTTGPDIDGLRGDICIFNGTVGNNNLMITQTGAGGSGQDGGFGGPTGVRLRIMSGQTGSVTIKAPTPSAGGTTGWRVQDFTIDAGAGAFSLGTNNTSDRLTMTFGGAAGQFHGWTNNSANPATINQDLKLQNGGGGAHVHFFTGTGNWNVNHTMITENSGPNVITKDGSGTMTWSYAKSTTAALNSFIQGPLTISGGLLIMTNSTTTASLFPTSIRAVQNDATLRWNNGAANADNFSGTISGAGQLQITSGTLTLSGQNTFTGNIQLSGGQLNANSGENVGVSGPLGVGGVISFSGGVLGYGNNNFDYSSRFDAAAGQQYKIDTGGQFVTFSNALASSGATLTKLGDGTLTLAGTNTYSGLTIVTNLGTLALLGPKTGSGNITVADGATLDVFDNGTQVTPATLTLGSSLGANLEFDNINSTTTAPLAPGTVSSTSTTIININSGTFHLATSYPLISWTSGSAPAVSLGIVDGASGTLTTNGNKIQFNVVTVALVWNGLTNNIWNINTSTNWGEDGNPTGFSNPKQAVLNDTAPGATDVTLSGAINPEALTINNSALTYSLASSAGNSLGGNIRLAKRGSGTLTLTGGANTNTGVLTLRGGTTIVSTLANGGVASDIGAASSAVANVVFNGGSLQYTGGVASIDRLFTVRSGGGTIDNAGTGPLTLNNPGAVSHGGKLTLDGNTADTNTLVSALVGGGSLTKNGTGTWVLTGTNSYGGATAINAGVLQVGAGGGVGALGSGPVANSTAIDFNRTGTLTVGGVITGNGSVTKNGSGTVILANNNNYIGGTTINAGTLQVGNGGSSGELYINGPIVNNATLTFTAAGIHTYEGAGVISGTGNVVVNGPGRIRALGANTYTGNTTIDGTVTLLPATFQPCTGNQGALASPLVTVQNNGRLMLVRQDNGVFIYTGRITGNGMVMVGANNDNAGDVTLLGTNDYAGGTFIGGQTLILGDLSTPVSGQIVGNVTFTNNFDTPNDNPRGVTFNRPDDFTFSGNIITNFATPQNNRGIITQNGAGKLTLTGNNTYGSGTVINAGTVQVGSGGGSGSLGFGPVTNNALLIFNRTGNLAVGTVNGTGSIVKLGSGQVTLAGNSSVDGNVDLLAGTLGAGASGNVGSLTVGGTMTIASGSTVLAGLNKSLSPSNGVFNVATTIAYTNGGTLKLINGGSALVSGDKFTIFNQPITNMTTIVSPGFTVVNNLAVDGSVTVNTVLPPPTLTNSVSGGGTTLNLSWDPALIGAMHLQNQTNTLGVGISTNWVTIPGSDAASTFSAQIRQTNPAVFYRLINP